jgi:hypothetical protein
MLSRTSKTPLLLASTLALILLPSFAASAQKGGPQKDVPLRVTLYANAQLMNLDGTAGAGTVPSAVVDDGKGVYTADATIKFSSSTYDAVLNMLVSNHNQRTLTVHLPAPIPGTATAQTPASGNYAAQLLNVHNIICHGCASPGQPFVTRVNVGQLNGTYGLHSLPLTNPSTLPEATGQDGAGAQAIAVNYPNATSWAMVIPRSYNCAIGVYPSWIVRATLQNAASSPSYLAVGGLLNANTGVSVGQYSVPFEALIEATQCFNPGY